MGKEMQNSRATKSGNLVHLEQTTINDDYPLPSTEELKKLSEIDEDAIRWLKERADREQVARLKFNDDKVNLTSYRELNM